MTYKAPILDLLVRREGLEKGACVGASPYHADLFHGTRKDQLLAQQMFCQVCPVVDKCAEEAKDAGLMVTRGSLWANRISASPRREKPRPRLGDGAPAPSRDRSKTSAYRGVCWAAREEKWAAHIRLGEKVRFIGHFPGTPEGEIQAAKAWDEVALAHRGENTFQNFPADAPPVSIYRGVNWAKRDGRWVVRLRVDGKLKFIGSFPGTPEGEIDAAKLWDQAVTRYRGTGTYRNFPEGAP